jgi:hypothetical protein
MCMSLFAHGKLLFVALCLGFVLTAHGGAQEVATQRAPIPPENRANLTQAPPRPSAESAEALARTLFDAIVADDPARAAEVFFPRPAFLHVKDIADPGRYYDQLYKRFFSDVHALHARLAGLPDVRFERFELSKRGGFIQVHEEANRLPYWAARHNVLHYRSGSRALSFEVRVLITWGNRWYLIHLNEFH